MRGVQIPAPQGASLPAPATCILRCLGPAVDADFDLHDIYLFDGPTASAAAPPALAAAAGVVLPARGEDRAAALLAAGARRVLLGEAALVDNTVVSRLAGRFGTDRIGVYVPARRIEVSWSFDTISNADFRVLTPSVGAPAWEVLRADGARTGTQALWWAREMFKLGASELLLRVDILDDADLNLCAECVDTFGDRAWIGPLADAADALDHWVHHGRARQLALPSAACAHALALDAQVAAEAAGRAAAERAA